MVNDAEVAQKLENMGVEVCETLEESIARPELESEIPHHVARLVLLSDAYKQLENGNQEDAAHEWTQAASSFVEKAIRLGRVSTSLAKISILKPRLKEIQILEWFDVRHEVFTQNPQYHGRRFGLQYGRAVASGQLKLKS